MLRKLRSLFFKLWYWYISTVDKDADIIFMNFGYADNNEIIPLKEEDEKNRYSIQLYHHTVSPVDIKGKKILEIGCGRGGGLAYVHNHMMPASSTGIDLNIKAIQFCKRHYRENHISFLQGNAQNLPFEDNSFDVVINVESSHRYPQAGLFFKEVYRVLKQGGYFLFSDFRHDYNVEDMESQLNDSEMVIEKKEDITGNVLKALTINTPDREDLIKKVAPRFLRKLGRHFAATTGTPVYNKFLTRKFLYFSYVLRKVT